FEQVVRLFVGVNPDIYIADFFVVGLVIAKGEAGGGKGDVAFPRGDQFFSVDSFAGLIAGRDQLIVFGIPEGEIEVRAESEFIHAERPSVDSRVPAKAFAKIVAITDFADDALAGRIKDKSEVLTSLSGFRQDNDDVVAIGDQAVFGFTRLNEIQRVAISVLYGIHTQILVLAKEKSALAGTSWSNCELRGGREVGVFSDAGRDLISSDEEVEPSGRVSVNGTRIPTSGGKIHPDVTPASVGAVGPTADENVFQLQRVLRDFDPSFFLRFEFCEEIGCGLGIGRDQALEEAKQMSGAEALSLAQAFCVEIF